MKKTISNTYLSYLLAILLSVTLFSCEGLDDWTELQSIDLFNSKNDNLGQKAFKRYSLPGLSSQPVVEFIYDPSAKFSALYHNEIKKACDYTKIPFHSMSINTWNGVLKIAPTTRVFVVYDTKKLNNASIPVLLDFVANGGTLFIPFASEDKRMAYLLGFKPEAEYTINTNAAGYYFNTPVLPGLKDKTYLSNSKLFGFSKENFSTKIKILATASNDAKYPTIIENTIGNGKVILYNTSGDFSKMDRGLLFAGVLKGLEGIPYPIANTATIFLDDFPAPQYEILAEPIKSEMNFTTSDFVEKVWWPDMRDLAKEFKIPYAAMLTFDYRNKIVPPFTLDQWNLKKIKTKDRVEPLPDWLVKDVAKNGHELAFHGYNHVSLLKEDWKNPKFIATSMGTVKKKWEISNYGNLPVTYVPPSNDIDEMGLVELKKAMPSIKYICSLYLGNIKDGGNREFDFDPFEKKLFDYPRISSGFYFKDDEKFTIQSLYLYTGIWTHFVHPDDVYQIPDRADKTSGGYSLRNSLNYGWRKTKGSNKALFPEFRNYIKQVTTAFPQMRFVNGNDGGAIVNDWRASRYNHKSEYGLYTVKEINPDDEKQYWFLYGSNTNTEKIEQQLKSQKVLFAKTPFMDGFLFSVYSNKPSLTSVDLYYKKPADRVKIEAINLFVKADFVKYNTSVKNFISGAIWNDDSDEKLKLKMDELKTKLLSNSVIDSVLWNKYAKFMSWENKADEVWKMYENHVSKNPNPNNIMYSGELDKVIGYTTDEMKEKWMSEQIKVNPNDKELLKSYYVNFDTDEYKEKIKNVLKTLYTLENTAENYKNYIRHLLNYYPDEALAELKDKKPDENLKELATPIIWLFADNAEYKKAIEWSPYSNEIDFVTKMNWYIDSGKTKLLEAEYLKYIATHPDDYAAKVLMSSVYHEQGKFKEAWVLANSLPEIPEKEELRKTLNKDVVYEEDELQQDLIANHSALFYPNVLKKLIKESRLAKGDFIDINSFVETNQNDPTTIKNLLSYNFYNKKGSLHGLSVSYDKYYKLELGDKEYDANKDNSTMGIQYKFTSAVKDEKPQYWSSARVEVDQKTSLYYQFGTGINYTKNNNYKSADFNLMPVETASGLNQKMYQMKLNLYNEFYLFKKINTTLSFEGNYYTKGLLSRDTITPIINPNRFKARKTYTQLENGDTVIEESGDAMDGALTLRMMLNDGEVKKSKLIPFVESQVSYGTKDLSNGYPYWMIKNRFYGGAGLGWEFGLTNFHSRIEAGYFLDTFSDHFERFSGIISYQIFDFTALTLNMELFNQEKYYSNSLQVGIKHNLKRRIRK